jgi:hypothetical protein
MDRDKVIEIFNDLLEGKRRDIAFSKGYPVFEEVYEIFKDDLERIDNGEISVLYRNYETWLEKYQKRYFENQKKIENREE